MRRLLVLGLFGLAGCVTPSIPIPPPDPSYMTFHLTTVDTVSKATFTYPSTMNYAGGVVYLYNRDKHGGVIIDVNTDDSIGPVTLTADANDQVVVTVQTDAQTISTCVRVHEGTGQTPNCL